MDFLDKLIYIYFIYYLSNECQSPNNKETLENKASSHINRTSMGGNSTTQNDLKEVELQRPELRKTIKHIVSK